MKRAEEMTGLWKGWKTKKQVSHSFHEPLGNLAKGARFPHSLSSGDGAMEKWKTKSRFPTFPPRS